MLRPCALVSSVWGSLRLGPQRTYTSCFAWACGGLDDVSMSPWPADAVRQGDTNTPTDTNVPTDAAPLDLLGGEIADCGDAGCLAGFVCIGGACEPGCRADGDCPEGQHCIPESLPYGFCAECADDKHCWTGRCVEGQCRVGCELRDDCLALPDAPVCDPINGVCVGCIDLFDCDSGNLCLRGTCIPGCTADDGCPDPLHCDTAAGSHGACLLCVRDGHCPEGQRCLNGRCGFDCDAIQCPFDRPLCVPETGACVECIDAMHCQPNEVCLGSACQPGCLQDADCSAELVCTGGVPGHCVGCKTEADCPEGAACILEQCVTAPCGSDDACGTGRYCHPALKTCYDLPPKVCSKDRDCGLIPGTQLGRNCDPLTRKCIAECLFGGRCPDPTMFCIDRSCYDCRADTDCPGTRCDPFDRACHGCTGDSNCLNAGWHCEIGAGACYPCVFDAHCGAGVRCHPQKHRCVECMIDADCRDPSRPSCAKDNSCVATCEEGCALGQDQCAPLGSGTSGVRVCGDYDHDACLELSAVQACPAGQACVMQGDRGACACTQECEAGLARCIDGKPKQRQGCIVDPATNCPRWVAETCSDGAACTGGVCTCTGECQYPSSKCDTDNWSYYYYCGRENGACLHWIHLQCDSGSTCDSHTGTCR